VNHEVQYLTVNLCFYIKLCLDKRRQRIFPTHFDTVETSKATGSQLFDDITLKHTNLKKSWKVNENG